MAKEASTLVWHEVDTLELSPNLAKLNKAREEARAKHNEAKKAFEAEFVKAARKADMIDDASTLAFGYNFGKLSIAKVNKAKEKKADAKPKIRL